jgi:hypothetical protein
MSQFRDLATSSSRIFGWDKKIPQIQFNQVVITPEQLREIGMLRDSMTPEGEKEKEEYDSRGTGGVPKKGQ